jgi:ribonucleoside-diphosphate reductase alpha chain
MHNVSATISLKPEDWDLAGEWMWSNRDFYNGLSVLPHDGGSYIQAPFTDCTKEEFELMVTKLHSIDLTKVIEYSDETDLSGEIACGAAGCEIK